MAVPLADDRDRDILEYLHRCGGADVHELCELLGVTRTAIRQRISRLELMGFLCCELQSQARGRPRHIYKVTPDGLHALGENYRDLAVVMWEVISGVEDAVTREMLIARVRNSLAARLGRIESGSASLGERVDHLASAMRDRGFNAESDHQAGLPILRETSCPFPLLADIDDRICQVERQVLEQVLGVPVEFLSRCRDGGACCEFRVKVPLSDVAEN